MAIDPKTLESLRQISVKNISSRPTFSAGSNTTPRPTFSSGQTVNNQTRPTFTLGQTQGAQAKYPTASNTEKKSGALSSTWNFAAKQMGKPIGLMAQFSEDVGTAIGTQDMSYLKNTPAHLGGILTGTRTNSFVDIYRKTLIPMGVNPTVATAAGLFIDIFGDPLNAVGGGLTKAGRAAEKVSALRKAGQVIKADSKLAREITKLGLKADDLVLAGTKAEQAQKAQRAFLKLQAFGMEKTIIKGDSIYAKAGLLNNVWKGTSVGKFIDTVFNTKTSNEAFNVVKERFDNLFEYRNGKVMEEAVDIQKKVLALSGEDSLKVLDVVETGKKTGVEAIDGLADQLTNNFKMLKDNEEGLGLLNTDIENYFPHIKVKEKVPLNEKISNMLGSPKKYSTALGSSKERKVLRGETISSINKQFGTKFFEERPAIAYAERALGSTRAVTSKQFFDSVKPFASVADDAVETAVKELKGVKFSPDVARSIDDYYTKIKPEELNVVFKTIDGVQNIWKAQALVAPSYHIRNFIGNMWNNHIAGVNKMIDYADAAKAQLGKKVQFVDNAGREWNTMSIIDEAQKTGVLGEGWYAKDIETAIGNGLDRMSVNPLSQNFLLYRGNRKLGEVVENNARLSHFIAKIREGATTEEAALSVKKYLFDYGDLTKTEKQIFKRIAPFYTWTRKNIPLQLEKALGNGTTAALAPIGMATGAVEGYKEDGLTGALKGSVGGAFLGANRKYSNISKIQNAIESGTESPNEKYLGSYIRDNIGIRYKKDDKGIYSYFLLGNWLPGAQAIDFLSQPIDNTIQMITPFLKTPYEIASNQSTFFENNFGQPGMIERYPYENQTFLGLTMRKKTANVLKNVRLLNELDKWNPGSIWGSEKGPSLLGKIAPKASINIPKIGPITPADKIRGKYTPEVGGLQRTVNLFLGKTIQYKESMGKKFYRQEKEALIRELERAHKDALRDGQKEYARVIREDIKKIRKK